MKLHAEKFGAAAATAICIIYSIGALTTLLPANFQTALSSLGYFTSLESYTGGAQIDFSIFAWGLLQNFFVTFIFCWLLAKLYNRFLDA